MKKLVNFVVDNYIIFFVYAVIGWIYEVSLFLIRDHVFVNRGVLFGPYLPIYGFGILILLIFLNSFMKKKHTFNNMFWSIISIFTVVTFITVTIIEYNFDKMYRVDLFIEKYGLLIFIINIIIMILVSFLVKKFKSLKNIDLTIIVVFLLIWIITTVVEYIGHYISYELSHTMLWDYSKDFLNINKRVNWDASRNFAIGGTLLLYTIQPILNKFLKNTKLNKKIIISLCIGIPMFIDIIYHVIF